MRCRSAWLCVLVLLLPSIARAAPPPGPTGPRERELFTLVNRDRQAHKLPPLVWSEELARVARAHSDDMARHGFVEHVSPRSGDLVARLNAAKVGRRTARENVGLAPGLSQVQEGFMNSPGHRQNILAPDVTHLGLGVVPGPPESPGLYVTQVFADPVEPLDALTARRELLARINAQRRQAGLPDLKAHPGLQQAAERAAWRLQPPLSEGVLQAATGDALKLAQETRPHSWAGVAVQAQTALELGDVRAPPQATEARARAIGVGVKTLQPPGGQRQVVLIILLGLSGG